MLSSTTYPNTITKSRPQAIKLRIAGKSFLQILFFFLLVTQISFAQWVQTNSPLTKKGELISQDRYSKIRVLISSQEDILLLARLGLSIERGVHKSETGIELFVDEKEIQLLEENGIGFTIMIPDWGKYYAERQQSEMQTKSNALMKSNLSNFHLGSMGGALTMTELGAELDSMKVRYPLLVSTKDSIGSSYQNRPIWAVKITKGSGLKPQALYMGGHHANEPMGIMAMVYFMWYLLEQYGSDPVVTMLLERRELYFVPLVNPDGYCYNEVLYPQGGGMWRKNRKPFTGAVGVDLNRNYGYMWGYNNVGSSPNPTSNNYRGTAPFSEPETQTMRNYINAHQFTVAFSYHSYTNYIAPPWGYNGMETPDSIFFRRLVLDMNQFNRYSYIGQSLFTINGEACDWMYGDTLSKRRIYPYAVEVGETSDGFWPLTSRILPLVEENIQTNLALAHAAGEYVKVDRPAVTYHFTEDSAYIIIPFVNVGAGAPPATLDITMECSDLDIGVTHITNYDWRNQGPLSIVARNLKPIGSKVSLCFKLLYNGGITLDTLTFRLGPTTVIYSDDAEETRSRWISTSNSTIRWDTTAAISHSGHHSFSESPLGNYPINLNSSFLLDSALVLSGVAAELSYWLRGWSEDDYDCLRTEISTDGGASWTPIAGLYTSPGSGVGTELPFRSPVTDGFKYEWIKERMDLTAFIGKTIRLRFRFTSDNGQACDGFYIDDISILSYAKPTDVAEIQELSPESLLLQQNFPNPFNPRTTIGFGIPEKGNVRLSVLNILGEEIKILLNEEKEAGYHSIDFNGSDLPSGVYFYRIQADPSSSSGQVFIDTKKMILLK